MTAAAERVFCDECSDVIAGDPVTDPAAVAWIGEGAAGFCSAACLEATAQRAVDAAAS